MSRLPELAGRSLTLAFSEGFDGPLSWFSEVHRGETWRTRYFHSGDTPMSRGVGLGSDSEIAIDSKYLGLNIDPFEVSNGRLAIKVRPATAGTQAAVRTAWPAWYQGPRAYPRFTSGLLTTQFSFLQRYGYFEARVKVPALRGGWPSFWLLGEAFKANGGDWFEQPTCDEIDVFEILTGDPKTQHMSCAWGWPATKTARTASATGIDLSSDFHTYGVLWTEKSLVFIRDGVALTKVTDHGLHGRMYMLIGLGTDGDWNRQLGFSVAANDYGEMLVDHVRAWRLD